MARDQPTRVRRPLATRIDSLEQLEGLVLLRRDVVPRTCADLAQAIGVSERAMARALDGLAKQGLVAVEGKQWRYAPATPELVEDVGALADEYATRPIEVMNTILTRSIERMRALADAFRFRTMEKK